MLLSDVCLSGVCLSVAYIGHKSTTDRPKKTNIGTEVTRDWNTNFKVKRSMVKVTRPLCSPPYWRVRGLQRWAWERVGRGKLLLRCCLVGDGRRFGAHGARRGAEHTVAAARLQLVFIASTISLFNTEWLSKLRVVTNTCLSICECRTWNNFKLYLKYFCYIGLHLTTDIPTAIVSAQ